MNTFIQLVICIFLSSLLLTAFSVDMWQYWLSVVLVIGNQICFRYAGKSLENT